MLYERPAALQRFVDCFENFIAVRVEPDTPAALAARRIFEALQVTRSDAPAAKPHCLPICGNLEEAVQAIPPHAHDSKALAEALLSLAPLLSWYKRQALDAGPEFDSGHANATIVGARGIEIRSDVWIGVSLMAPHITYPDHRHPPEEIYAVLSQGEWRQGDGQWWEPGIGGILYNTPHIVHAMRSGEHHLLAAWALWVG